MKIDLRNGLPESILVKVRKHASGTESLKRRTLTCHFCEHKAIIVFEGSQGHIQTKCRKCRKEAIYNVALRKNGGVMFRFVRN